MKPRAVTDNAGRGRAAPVWVTEEGRLMLRNRGLTGEWKDHRWMNTPGPFYTGQADFVLMGPTCSPDYVALDDEMVDIVFLQPITIVDFDAVMEAADCDPFGGYACDGNEHWTVEALREWWRRVPEIREHITTHLLVPGWYSHPRDPLVNRVGAAWLRFLDEDAMAWGREYSFFLDSARWPEEDEALPDL